VEASAAVPTPAQLAWPMNWRREMGREDAALMGYFRTAKSGDTAIR
jgi:hypothetical protein